MSTSDSNSSSSSSDSGWGSLIIVGILLLIIMVGCGKQAAVDSINHRFVEVSASEVSFRIQPDSNGHVPQLAQGQIPPGDFQIASVDDEGNPFVGDINNSVARWWKWQRTETYIAIKDAIMKSSLCDKIKLEVQGLNLNVPVLGKNYPVVISARPGC